MPRAWMFAVLVMLVAGVVPGHTQFPPTNGCADCHLATPEAPGREHVLTWDRSPHGRNAVSCSSCHGGNGGTFERSRAHRDMLGGGNRKSPLNLKNIPGTCGSCHVGPYVAFQESRHYALLQAGNDKAPTCVTCHGETDGRLLSAKALAGQCSDCHGPREMAPRADRVREVRELYTSVSLMREQMKLAGNLVKRINDQETRAVLQNQLEQAEVPLTRAVNAGHKFVYDELRTYLAQAQERVQALQDRLANR
jgi:hypothetical protein